MKTVTLSRSYTKFGVLGNLYMPGGKVLKTLERPWTENLPFISSIPPGSYFCRRVNSPSYGETFEVMDVTGRSHILFHAGNWIRNSKGCILLGLDDIIHENELMVTNSREAFADFMEELEGEKRFKLVVQSFEPEW